MFKNRGRPWPFSHGTTMQMLSDGGSRDHDARLGNGRRRDEEDGEYAIEDFVGHGSSLFAVGSDAIQLA